MEEIEDIGLQLLEEQELERKRIARELHDSTIQNLTTLIHKTELCSKLIAKDPIQAQLEMRVLSDTLRSCIKEMRDIIYDLRPMELDDLGLDIALERFITQMTMQNEVKMEIIQTGTIQEFLPVINMTLFRIITEACNNAVRHGKSKNVMIYLIYDGNYFFVKVIDDGCGFEVNQGLIEKKSFGISIMRERTHLLKGEFEIHSELGKGTTIEVKIPLYVMINH